MKFSYKFSNLLGTVYRKGNLQFSHDGNSVLSPVGNRITIFNLKDNKSETLPIESRYNIQTAALSPCGRVLIAINEDGETQVCSLVSNTVLHHHKFPQSVHCARYSPDGRYVAIVHGSAVFIYHAPGASMKQLNAFAVVYSLRGFFDDVDYVCWSSDSRFLSAASRDMTTRVCSLARTKNFRVTCLGGHIDCVVACFFVKNSLGLYTVGRNGAVVVWECSHSLEEIILDVDDDEATEDSGEDDDDDLAKEKKKRKKTKDKDQDMAVYQKTGLHFARKGHPGDSANVCLTAAAFHDETRILVAAFSNGAFFLHEMPECNLIHSLSIDAGPSISSVCFNCTGDWLALACGGLGQLVVWEWQSETYVLKQQGHFNNMACVTYSPDGQFLVTGGDDAKVKVWNVGTGFCVVTFTEHQSGISSVCFGKNGNVIVSASLDGTVRAFDLTRYRNFKTFTSPKSTQFASLAVDPSGEIICAGGQDNFEIFVWSMQTGRLLEILSGHTAPVSSLTFSPTQAVLISASWDKNVRIWDVFTSKGSRETINVLSDALAVTFRPDGVEFAVATLNGQISFFEVRDSVQTGSIEGRNDLSSGRRDTDLVSANQVQKGKAFTTLCYTADGDCILAAGQSKHVCIYHVKQQILLKKFEISQNHSFDAMDDFISRRKMSEFGNLALVEEREPNDGDRPETSIALPGVKKGDMASRSFKPEVRVSCIRFAPTGRSFAATTTEGLLLYSLDHNLVFDPIDLETDVTTSAVRKAIRDGECSKALMMALKLKEHKLVVEAVESVSVDEVMLIVSTISPRYLERFIAFLSDQLESSAHLEFYLVWVENLLMTHGQTLKTKSMHILASLQNLHRSLVTKRQQLEKICDYNKYTLQYISSSGEIAEKRQTQDSAEASVLSDVNEAMELE